MTAAAHAPRPEQIFELLDAAFPGLGLSIQARAARPLGCRWEEISTPFAHFEAGRLVAHVGVLEMPLVLEGREVCAGAIHAVATHPDHRRRGLFRSLLSQALRWCDARYETLLLTTERPGLYEPFGFRVASECRFRSTWRGRTSGCGLRRLDPRRSSDRARIQELLVERAPLSRRLGVVREQAVFAFNEARRPLHYAEDLEAVLSLEFDGNTLRLFDVVSRKIPPLASLVARSPRQVERVELYFSPDRFEAIFETEGHVLGGDLLMVRGPFPPEGKAFMLPRTARC